MKCLPRLHPDSAFAAEKIKVPQSPERVKTGLEALALVAIKTPPIDAIQHQASPKA